MRMFWRSRMPDNGDDGNRRSDTGRAPGASPGDRDPRDAEIGGAADPVGALAERLVGSDERAAAEPAAPSGRLHRGFYRFFHFFRRAWAAVLRLVVGKPILGGPDVPSRRAPDRDVEAAETRSTVVTRAEGPMGRGARRARGDLFGPSSGRPTRLVRTRLRGDVGMLFSALGTTPGELAESLEEIGVRGVRGAPDSSPAALYLSAVVGADPGIKAVSFKRDTVRLELRKWWRSAVVVPLPLAVQELAAAFDAGCYPALLRPDDRHARGRQRPESG